MSAVTHGPLSPSSSALPSAKIQVSTELEQNPSVSCLHHLSLAFADDSQVQNSGSGFFANSRNILITGGTFVSPHRLYK